MHLKECNRKWGDESFRSSRRRLVYELSGIAPQWHLNRINFCPAMAMFIAVSCATFAK